MGQSSLTEIAGLRQNLVRLLSVQTPKIYDFWYYRLTDVCMLQVEEDRQHDSDKNGSDSDEMLGFFDEEADLMPSPIPSSRLPVAKPSQAPVLTRPKRKKKGEKGELYV